MMNLRDIKINKGTSWSFMATFAVLFGACSNEENIIPETPEDSVPVRIAASVTREIASRANPYQETGDVTQGMYYMTYPNSSGENNVATVNFSTPEYEDTGIGIVTSPSGKELEWKMVGGGANPTLYLDNVAGNADGTPANETTVTFTDDYNPFKAAVFDTEGDAENDLLWGSLVSSRGTRRINFDLHHNMSRIRVIVKADEANAPYDEVNLEEGSTVTISSIAQTPESFNRLNGNLTLLPEYTDLVLVDNTVSSTGENWLETTPGENDTVIYTTKDFVLPPQILLEDDVRPRLTITTKGGKTFSGILPHAMEVNYPEYENPYPVALAFLKEHILTIETIITQDPPELVFMPVQVIEWVYKGNFTLEGHQAGFYLEQDFLDFLKYYQEGNVYQLARYGYIDEEGEWIFNFFRSIILDWDEIANQMNPAQYPLPETMENSFSFVFNNYTVRVNRNGSSFNVTPMQLKQILTTGTYTAQP